MGSATRVPFDFAQDKPAPGRAFASKFAQVVVLWSGTQRLTAEQSSAWPFSQLNFAEPKTARWSEKMANPQPNNPLHGITLEMMLNHLVEQYGWEKLGKWIPIQCFRNDPSIKSSLKFLRRTPWARQKVEDLYLKSISSE